MGRGDPRAIPMMASGCVSQHAVRGQGLVQSMVRTWPPSTSSLWVLLDPAVQWGHIPSTLVIHVELHGHCLENNKKCSKANLQCYSSNPQNMVKGIIQDDHFPTEDDIGPIVLPGI